LHRACLEPKLAKKSSLLVPSPDAPLRALWHTVWDIKNLLKNILTAQPAAIVLVVAGVLMDRDGRVLVQRRPPGVSMAGLWEFPGGKVETGETPESALVRELDEEVGVTIDVADMAPITFASAPLVSNHLVLLLYHIRSWVGDPQPRQAEFLQWTRLDDLAALDMPPADKPLVEFLKRVPSLSA
jgi:8-oxo-dGTP diphosphatase